ADLCSVTAHKFGGPRGIGALLVRRGLRLPPFLLGGAQERGRRAGLENVAAAVGFAAAAAELAGLPPFPSRTGASGAAAAPVGADRLTAEAEAARTLTERLLAEAPKAIDGLTVFGDPVDRLPHLVCFGVEGV